MTGPRGGIDGLLDVEALHPSEVRVRGRGRLGAPHVMRAVNTAARHQPS
jgi:hypothetical protein